MKLFFAKFKLEIRKLKILIARNFILIEVNNLLNEKDNESAKSLLKIDSDISEYLYNVLDKKGD